LAAHERGREHGAAAELVYFFAVRMVAAGLAPGVPEAHIWGHVLGLAAAAANAAANAVRCGAATPLELVPELAPSVLGCVPGTPAHAALVRALGPYAVLARLAPGAGAPLLPVSAHLRCPGPMGDPGQHSAPSQVHLVAMLLDEVCPKRWTESLKKQGPPLASMCLSTIYAHPHLAGPLVEEHSSTLEQARKYVNREFLVRVNRSVVEAVPSAAFSWPLATTPGAAAVMAKLRVSFFLAWGRGDRLEQAAASRKGGALLASFARRALAAGCVPGHRAARTPEQADLLARAAAIRDADAVAWGVATPLSLCPALPDEVVGGPPGSPAAVALERADTVWN